MISPIINSSTLNKIMKAGQPIRLIDASYEFYSKKHNFKDYFSQERIPGSILFEFNKLLVNPGDFLHRMPTLDEFCNYMKQIKVQNDEIFTVVYDRMHAKTAAKVWHLLKIFGKKNISVLDGGFETWKASELELESGSLKENSENGPEKYEFSMDNSKFKSFQVVEGVSGMFLSDFPQTLTRIIDARSPSRHLGIGKEPDPNLGKGNIQGSKNIYYKNFLNNDNTFKDKEEIQKIIKDSGFEINDDLSFIHYSGIGLSACINILAFEIAGISNSTLYNGSWMEWVKMHVPPEYHTSTKDILEDAFQKHTEKKLGKPK